MSTPNTDSEDAELRKLFENTHYDAVNRLNEPARYNLWLALQVLPDNALDTLLETVKQLLTQARKEPANHYICCACHSTTGECCEDCKSVGCQARKGYKGGHRPKQELVCELCDRDYPVWFAPNALWNKVMRHPDGKEASEKHNFVCMDCFATEAEKLGIKPTAWMLTTQAEVDQKVAEALTDFVEWHNAKYDSSYSSGIATEHITEYLEEANPHTPPQEQDNA